MDMSDYLEDALLELTLNNGASPATASVFIALYTTATDDAGGGTEVTGGSYARVELTGGFTVGGPTPTRGGNTSTITFPTASADWGIVTHVGIRTLSAGGNLLYHGALDAPRTVDSGDVFSFAADAIGVALA